MKSNFDTFISGIGSISESLIKAFNPQQIKVNYYPNDLDALKNDWNIVGESIRKGIDEYETSQGYKSTKE